MSARKLMATVFWDRKGQLMVEYTRDHSNITSILLNTKKNHIWPFREKGMEC
jgi:hypothetical protein